MLAFNPRRTSESYFSHYLPNSPAEAFRESNPIPNTFKTLNELWNWHKPLIDAEIEKKRLEQIKEKSTLVKKKVKKASRKQKLKGKTKKRSNREITEYWLQRRRRKSTRKR